MTPLRLVLGTADLAEEQQAWRLFDQFYEAGGRALDLANVYGQGASEIATGRWLRRRGGRDDVVLYVKGCHPPHCRPELLAGEVEQARTNLRKETLDVFLIHRDDSAIAIGAWAEAIERELERGTIRQAGVSNWTAERFIALRNEVGEGRIIAFSNHFSLAEMVEPPWPGCLAIDSDTAHSLAAAGITILAWASLARGYLGGANHDSDAERCWGTHANQLRRARAAELAALLGTTSAAIAIAYVLARPGIRPVVGTRSQAHLTEALTAETIDLTPEQVELLESGRPR